EVIDIRAARPLDARTLRSSVRKTGYLVVVDNGWRAASLGSEVAAAVVEDAVTFSKLKGPIKRIAWADTPAPTCCVLEQLFYPTAETIVAACIKVLKGKDVKLEAKFEEQKFHKKRFAGSF
ncbi:hypothetical protein KJ605_02565, partial [Patescibacteria group bacterium]|nr:hypothetical protein [Patescibacteria group bacterium]MBU1970633.1 hypothetical protein [Patescibacteria group bacterium]